MRVILDPKELEEEVKVKVHDEEISYVAAWCVQNKPELVEVVLREVEAWWANPENKEKYPWARTLPNSQMNAIWRKHNIPLPTNERIGKIQDALNKLTYKYYKEDTILTWVSPKYELTIYPPRASKEIVTNIENEKDEEIKETYNLIKRTFDLKQGCTPSISVSRPSEEKVYIKDEDELEEYEKNFIITTFSCTDIEDFSYNVISKEDKE